MTAFAKFSVLLHYDCAWTGGGEGRIAWTVGGDDC